MSKPPAPEFDEIVREHTSALQRFFRKRIAEKSDVDDLVQEVFLKLARRGIDNIDHYDRYLYRAALNVLRDRIRSQAVRHTRDQTELQDNYLDDAGFSPERVLEGKEALTTLEDALRELPNRTQEVFALSRFAEMRNPDIAQQLGVSVSAIEKHITKALLHLSKRLGDLI